MQFRYRTFFVILLSFGFAYGSHFRGGIISWLVFSTIFTVSNIRCGALLSPVTFPCLKVILASEDSFFLDLQFEIPYSQVENFTTC